MKNVARVEKDQAPAVVGEPSTVLQAILRIASDPQCDIEKMERLMAMHERMQIKQAETEFNAALSRVQAEMGRISTDATNNQTRSNYATYGKLDSVLRPKYTKEGFSLSFGTEPAPDGMVGMICFVSHTAGHTREYRAHVPSDGKGAKGGDVMTKTHAFGSGTSYGMRYLLKMIFNVAIGEEDYDGNGAGGDDFREAIMTDLISKVDAASDKGLLQEAWQAGLKVLHAAKDAAGAEVLREAVNKRKAQLENAK